MPQLVPDAQITDCIERIMGPRHKEQMAALLAGLFEERISALKGAVEKVSAPMPLPSINCDSLESMLYRRVDSWYS